MRCDSSAQPSPSWPCYLAVQSTVVLVARYHPGHSPLGIASTALTALVMFALAAGEDSAGASWITPRYALKGG